MSESKMSDIIRTSLESIKSFSETETVIGNSITTPTGVTVIPITKITVGIASGGIDYSTAKTSFRENFGGGGGGGLSIIPIAFLTVNKDYDIKLIKIDSENSTISKISGIVESVPDIIEKIKNVLS